MTILLAGSTGFLGSYLLKKFIDSGHKVIALKRASSDTYRIDTYRDKVTFYDINTVELSNIFETYLIDIVINTVTNYGRSDKRVSSIVQTNLLFGLKLLEAASENSVKAFINTDTLLDRNINAYALSKAQLVDWMIFFSNQTTKMINIKIEHMYGPLDDENKFISWVITQLKQNVEKIDLTSGEQKRDFVFIEDVVSAYIRIIDHLAILPNYEEFELGSGRPTEVKVFIDTIYNELSKRHSINTVLNFGTIAYREHENMCMSADICKLQKLGWNPTVSIQDGIKRIIRDGEN